MCLGRGITFQSEGFAFDYGVLPDMGDPASAYQCVARLLGNIKAFPDYKPPSVFLSESMKQVTLDQEKIATRIAQKVSEQGWEDVGIEEIEYILHEDPVRYARARRGENTEVLFSPTSFATTALAIAWSKTALVEKAYVMHLCGAEGEEGEDTHFRYRKPRQVVPIDELKRSDDLSWGQAKGSGSPRVMPVLVHGDLEWLVVYKPHWV
jgi:hypothetical protein